jgi:hypothetical protein
MNVIFFLLLTSLKKFWKLGFAKILKGKSMFHCLVYVLSLSCSPGRQSTTWAIPQSKRYFKNKCVNSFFHITQLSTCLKISTSGICLCLNCNVIYWVFPVPPKYAHQKQMVPPNKIKFQVLLFFYFTYLCSWNFNFAPFYKHIFIVQGWNLLWQFWITLHCTLVRLHPSSFPNPLLIPPKAITKAFIILFPSSTWSPSTLFLDLHLFHSALLPTSSLFQYTYFTV